MWARAPASVAPDKLLLAAILLPATCCSRSSCCFWPQHPQKTILHLAAPSRRHNREPYAVKLLLAAILLPATCCPRSSCCFWPQRPQKTILHLAAPSRRVGAARCKMVFWGRWGQKRQDGLEKQLAPNSGGGKMQDGFLGVLGSKTARWVGRATCAEQWGRQDARWFSGGVGAKNSSMT